MADAACLISYTLEAGNMCCTLALLSGQHWTPAGSMAAAASSGYLSVVRAAAAHACQHAAYAAQQLLHGSLC